MQKCVVFLRQKPCFVHLATLKNMFVNMQGKIGVRNISVNGDMSGQSQVPAFEFCVKKTYKKPNEIKTQSCYVDILKLMLWSDCK